MITLNFDPFPVLSSERLDFRALHVTDVNEVYELRSNPKIMEFIPRPLAKNKEDALEHIKTVQETIIKKEGINWGITLKGSSKIIGIAGFYRIQPNNSRAEMGYILLSEYHNKGYITEAIRTLLSYAFYTMKFHSIEAVIDPLNYASERVLQKNGFVKEAHIIENEWWNGRYMDTVIYSILKRNFK